MAFNVAVRSRLSEEEAGGADERTPRCSERERERVSADRRAQPRSERGKRGRARGQSAMSGPRHWAARASRAGARCWAATAQSQG